MIKLLVLILSSCHISPMKSDSCLHMRDRSQSPRVIGPFLNNGPANVWISGAIFFVFYPNSGGGFLSLKLFFGNFTDGSIFQSQAPFCASHSLSLNPPPDSPATSPHTRQPVFKVRINLSD